MEQVSIVMASYNGESYIREQIDSIINNTYSDWKLEICDDGSLDGTISIIKEYVEKYPNRIFFHENDKNLGVVQNFLEGAKRAEGNYIMFADQDDVWLPEKISHTLEKMKEIEQEDTEVPTVVFTDAKVVNERLEEIASSFHQISSLDTGKTDLPHLLMENKLIGCTMMFNQAVAKLLYELPQNARYHDWWIGLLAASMGRIAYLKEGTLLYRQHGNNEVGAQNFFSYVRGRLISLKKQKQALLENQKQAEEFLKIYEQTEKLSASSKEVLYIFSTFSKRGFFYRKWMVWKGGYLKTGWIRNIGLLLLV